MFTSKQVRDLLTLDQVSTEVQRTVSGRPFAFWAVDPATIYRVDEEIPIMLLEKGIPTKQLENF